jgi:MFS family permease
MNVFAVNHLHRTKSQTVYLISAFFLAGTIAKFIMLFLVTHVKIEISLFSGLIVSVISTLALSLLVNVHSSIMWVFSILLSVSPTIVSSVQLAWTDKHIGIKGHIGTIFSVAESLGSLAFSPLIGFLFDKVSYMSFMYLNLTSTILCTIFVAVLEVIGQRYNKEDAQLKSDKHTTDAKLIQSKFNLEILSSSYKVSSN